MCLCCASVENILRNHLCPSSRRNGIKPPMINLASVSCSGRNVNVTTFSDRHCLSMVWKRGTEEFSGVTDIISSLNNLLDMGSILSSIRLVDISQVVQVPNPADKAVWCAKQEANFVLLFMEKTEEKTGTSLILVPLGKVEENESYHTTNFFFVSCNLSEAHSTCSV